MSGSLLLTLLPGVVVVAIVAVASGIYADAKAHTDRGRPIVFQIGPMQIDSPAAWFTACLLVCVLFVPIYITLSKGAD